ncbi:MAG: Ldh family oxidoreductase [candidate division WOR-3 bacterium]|nr:Ldh family oxidoreductase [candidate division WOR-3 bacterium]
MIRVRHTDLHSFMKEVLIGVKVPEEHAEIIADVLIDADIKGIDSHGISRLKKIYYDRIKQGIVNPETDITIEKESLSSILINGNNGMGHVVSQFSLLRGIEKAKEGGSCMVAVKDSSHYGIAGYYTDLATARDCICITGTNARPSVSPIHGIEGMMGTNPLTIGIPTDEDFNFNIDCATSIAQRGKVEYMAREGRELPDNWVKDSNGKPVTNPYNALKMLREGDASFVPLGGTDESSGGHKGYGYTASVEILSAAFQNGPFLKMLNGMNEKGEPVPYHLGHFFIIIDPSHLIDIDLFKNTAGNILRQLRNSAAVKGERIYTPGEKEYYTSLERKKNGIPITDNLLEEMKSMDEECGLGKIDSIVN